jgi:hypothetical protein
VTPIVSHAGATDAELLSRTREDPQAFGAFYDRFEADVLACSMVGWVSQA